MKRILIILIVSMMVLLALSGCAIQPAAESTEKTAVTQTPAAAQLEPTLKPIPDPTPEPEPYVPEDILGSEFNPYADTVFPENFDIYSASINIGDPKWGGKPKFSLSMTAEGKTDEAIAFLAQLAGIEDEDSKLKSIEEFKGGGFCEFKSADGATFTIKKTDPNDDRYEYVDGCHIDILANADDDALPRYISLVSDNYSLNALNAAADYFDIQPTYDQCAISLDYYKGSAEVSVRYDVKDAGAIQQKMAEELKPSWYDAENGRMGFTYGMIDFEIQFDSKEGQAYVRERIRDFKAPARDYAAPEVSLTTLGFYYAEKDALCIYEDKQNGISIAVHRPEWGTGGVDWNIEYLCNSNKYLVAVWYDADQQKYRIQADKGGSSAAYEYDINAGEYGNEWPDPETVKKQFISALGIKDDDVYPKALDMFEQTVEDLFGMSVDELYALPPK